MSELRYCPMCGSKLPADAPAGLCPQCLLKQGFESGVGADSASRGATVIGAGFVPPAPEELAKHFPQLEILELIGKGGMGAVYKARQPALDRIVALKILPPEVGTDPAFAERFTREARALAKLSHQNIVAVYDFGKTSFPDADSDPDVARDGLYYFLMEYVDGANLRQLIKSGGTQPAEALAIVPQICEALEFAHGEGVVHRDIKPENILVDQKGRVKIADFGLAKLLQAEPVGVTLTQAGQVMGTWYYMAPEQIERPLEVDHRADIYSLGVVFYEMLTGHVPSGRFDPPSKTAQIDVRLDEVVLRALEREPSRRYQHASDVKTQVESICGMPHAAVQRVFGREFRSKTTLFGWPLVHIAFGLDPLTGRSRTAKGIIAIGDRAVGGVAIGGAAAGVVAIGGAAAGLLSLGGVSLGILAAIGGLAVGGLSFGGMAVGIIAVGGGAIGLYAGGGWGWGLHVLSSSVRDPEAEQLFQQLPWARAWPFWMAAIGIGMPIAGALLFAFIWLVFYRQATRSGNLTDGDVSRPSQRGFAPTLADGGHSPDDPARLARRPAIGLIIVGAMQLLFVAMYLLGTLADWEQRGFEAAWSETQELGPILLTGMALSVPVSILIILGAVRMMNLQSYRFALAAAILALLPLTFMVVVGVPFGIWALVVLARQRVKAAFPERPPAADDASLRPVRGPGIGLVVTGIANWIGIPIAISILLYFAAGPEAGGDPFILLMMVALTALLASSLMIAAGLLMMRQQAFWLCVVGSVLALVVTPGNLIGLPIGIWALVVLSQTDVRKRFGADRESSNGGIDSRTGPNAGRHLLQGPAESLLIVGGAALLWALGIGLWLAFASAGWDPDAPGSSPQRRLQSGLLMFSITYAVYALCLAAAGLLMRRLHARLFALLSVVLVGILLPATLAVNVMMEHESIREWPVGIPMWLGMPVALWAAMVLFRHDVRDAFAIRESNASAERPGTLARAWNDWWSQRDRTFTTIAKIVLLVLYVIGLWTFFSSQGGGRAEAFRHTIGQPSPWFVVEKDSGGFRWHITLNSWAWLVAFAAFGCYYAWYRIRLTEGTKIGRFETPPAQIVFWGVIAVFAIALAMSPLFLY